MEDIAAVLGRLCAILASMEVRLRDLVGTIAHIGALIPEDATEATAAQAII